MINTFKSVSKAKKKQKIQFQTLLATSVLFVFAAQPVLVLAQSSVEIVQDSTQQQVQNTPLQIQTNGSLENSVPVSISAPALNTDLQGLYQKTFMISAYYSPLVNQSKYVTGSYSGDIRLNGGGIHGADGSPVYPGMIAAPKTYAYGTKMKIPGIGTVAVHDRGGAIVLAGERNQAYDRLDVWMGFGDIGLHRALNWGRRSVEVTVYGVDSSIQEQVYLEGYSEAEKYVENTIDKVPQMFAEDLNLGEQGVEVEKLQTSLQKLGYFKGNITKIFDLTTQQALVSFQIVSDIVDTENDFGAGYFGPQTRKTLELSLKENKQKPVDNLPKLQLGKDDQGEEVKKLQLSLQQLGFEVEVNGIYDNKTIEAIFKFQRENKILDSKNDLGAGILGPKTLLALNTQLKNTAVQQSQVKVEEKAALEVAEVMPVSINAFTKNLKLGDRGDDVTKLQQELQKMNLLAVETSGYYGEITQHAVFKLQQNFGLAESSTAINAGTFDNKTRDRVNSLLAKREKSQKLIADRKSEYDSTRNIALK